MIGDFWVGGRKWGVGGRASDSQGAVQHLPDADIHVIAAGEDIGAIPTEAHTKDALHALCVENFLAVPTIVAEHANRPATAACHLSQQPVCQ